ncbi:MAG: hypothetical protein ACWGQW_24650, partial [bacterium]
LHLERLREISILKEKGLTLSAIAYKLTGEQKESSLPSPTNLLQFGISNDVSVIVRGDVAPWRMRKIQQWLAESSRWLEEPTQKEE